MKIEDIFTGGSFDKYLELASSQSKFSSGADAITAGHTNLKKWKMVAGDSLMVVPMAIHIPFNLATGVKMASRMPILGSVRFAVKLLKFVAGKNPMVKDALREMLKEDFEKLNFSSDSVSEGEVEIFRPFREIITYAATVMSVHPEDSKYSFGTPYRVDIKYDADSGQYVDDPSNPLIWDLYRFETSCLATIAAQKRADNENAGAARRTDAELDATIKKMWNDRCITNPYSLGTSRVIFFPTNRNYEIDKKVVDGWKPEASHLGRQEVYVKVNRKTLEQLNSIKNSKYDRYEDFLLVKVHVDDFTEETIGTAAQSISRTGASSDEKIETMLKDFIPTYTSLRDDLERWDEKVIMGSAFEYRRITDDSIRATFKNSLGTLKSALKTQDILDKYADVIAIVDSKVSAELLETAMSEDLAQAPATTGIEANNAPVISEDTDGYGGDSMEARGSSGLNADDAEAIRAALAVED